MSKIWFTSDTHYFHRNIAGPKVSSWKSGYRDFEDEKEMSRYIVKVFNQLVSEDDILYHLGDWSFAGLQNIWNFRKQLRCKNIHLILGNHDSHIKRNVQLQLVGEERELYQYLTGYSANSFNSGIIDIETLFSSVQDMLEIEHGKHKFFLNHYPHLSWHHASKGVIMLHGHEHGKFNHLNINSRRLDVGIDSAKMILGEYRPFSIEEVIDINDRKKIIEIEHHKK